MKNLYVMENEHSGFTALILADTANAAKKAVIKYRSENTLKPEKSRWGVVYTSIDQLEQSINYIKSALIYCEFLLSDDDDITAEKVDLDRVSYFLLNERTWTQQIYVATEETNLVMTMNIADGVNINTAVRLASKEYCMTEKGKTEYENNCHSFNWGDFDLLVPREICRKYGFVKTNSDVANVFDFNEQLVNEDDIFSEENA